MRSLQKKFAGYLDIRIECRLNVYMNTSQIVSPSATATPVFATGTRVMYDGIPATVIAGNVPDAWCADFPLVSLHLDRPVKRGYAPYVDAYATVLTAI